jgi:magnesium-transporting ATPase (P-type)
MIFLKDLGTVLTVVVYVFRVISMIFLLDLGTVLTVWYNTFFILLPRLWLGTHDINL